jgi:geranylgeranyl diphosphate synthase type II
MALPPFFTAFQDRLDRELDAFVPATEAAGPVEAAMRYTLLAPSKRVRAALVLLAAELCGGPEAKALPAACAIEAVHAASLMLDDLPSMDNAPLRRGQPAAHLVHGEAVTVLGAFALLNAAYGRLADAYEPALGRRLATLLSDAVGLDGLVAGQAEDLLATDEVISFETLERIHRRKTGVLFSAAATAGAMTAGAPADQIASLEAYAKNLGLAFQIVDDLLDVTGTSEETGKVVRHDARKTTFVSFSGVEGARSLAVELCRTATEALAPFGRPAERLSELAAFVGGRRH